ncbi:MAG: HD domain-containing phosphohydrolase [Thermoanaerobaculales bacterium]
MTNVKGKVLAIDDDPDVLDLLADTLSGLGYEFWQSADGAEGYRLAVENRPDVILLDLKMPGVDGFEVCRMLKGNCETSLIPVVFLTGHGSRKARIEALDLGAADFLNKPTDLMELEARVRNLVAFHRMMLDLDSAEEVIFTFAKALEARDRDTGDHCARLSHLAVRLGERLGLDDEQITALRRGGYLHDVGKIGIPDSVLLNPGKPDRDEWETIKRHAVIGWEICRPLRSLTPVLPLIRHHHERCDGSGYPDGLVGEEIPLLARVFQVVDVFDAMTDDRSYRRGISAEDAIEIILEETRLGYWDKAIIDEFVAMIREEKFDGRLTRLRWVNSQFSGLKS